MYCLFPDVFTYWHLSFMPTNEHIVYKYNIYTYVHIYVNESIPAWHLGGCVHLLAFIFFIFFNIFFIFLCGCVHLLAFIYWPLSFWQRLAEVCVSVKRDLL